MERETVDVSELEKVCLGVITGPHGVHGEVKIKSFTEAPEGVGDYGPVTDASGQRTFDLCITGSARGQLIARIEGVADRIVAESLKGIHLYVPRSALPAPAADEYYHADLIGLRVQLTDGTPLGILKAIHNFGAGDLIEIERPGGRTIVMPFNRSVVPVVDLGDRRVVVEPPEGSLDGVTT